MCFKPTCQVLIHIADAPCHGNQYHSGSSSDTYPRGDPAGISHESMMEQVAKRHIDYWFGYIDKGQTDKMIGVFNHSLSILSQQELVIRQFNAMDPKEVGDAIQR